MLSYKLCLCVSLDSLDHRKYVLLSGNNNLLPDRENDQGYLKQGTAHAETPQAIRQHTPEDLAV